MWKLKTQTWTEVRPYEWPKLGEQERVNVCRRVRLAFADLKIPESDPLWDHVRFRSTVHVPQPVAGSSRSGSQAPPAKVEQKKPAMPKEKAKAAVRKKDPPIMAKDERTRASGSSITAKNESRQPAAPIKPEPAVAPLPPKPARRLPGSGFKAKPTPTPPDASPTPVAPPKRLGPVDAREARRDPSVPSGSARPMPPIPPPAKANSTPKTVASKAKDPHDSDASTMSGALKRKKVSKQEEGELVEPPPPPSGGIKRKRKLEEGSSAKDQKSVKQEEGELLEPTPPGGVKKKRKVEDGGPVPIPDHLAPSRRTATREPSPLSRSISKEPPQKPLTAKERADSISKSTASKSTNGDSSKFKRGRDIYTSSEEEADRPSNAKNQTAPQTKSSHSGNVAGKKGDNNQHQRARAPLPKDIVGLRKRYKSTYLPYILTYQRVITEKTRIENALSGSLTDSDADVDFMDVDNLTKLTEEHKLYKDELESIQAAYTKAGGGTLNGKGSSSSD
jgi:RNA polymerase II elongation factor ELL